MSVKIIAGFWAGKYELPEALELRDGASISEALAALAVPTREIGLASVNGAARTRDFKLSGGDSLEIFPVIIDG